MDGWMEGWMEGWMGRAKEQRDDIRLRLCVMRWFHKVERQDRETSERAHEEEMASATLSARERESELALMLQHTEAEHQQRGECFPPLDLTHFGELDGLLSSQNSLLRRLKEECCALGVKLEELTESSGGALEQLALEKQHLVETVRGLRARCSDMEDQCVQHGRMHQRMKNRICQ
ncbi:Serologically defined colon cancer antigen 8 [Liparis tanakae]|uniref:Serologically defined colon cancer antigen 8 n=1 Tax=Liparis tanakae TaxID=230148 RepID=A0A4Z2HF68_9TELE|nr:Serologically defined colon cancer antigen 8 [Liparis tanakae]